MEAWRAENQLLKKQGTTPSPSADADVRELARLRNEVSQLRKQVGEAQALRAQTTQLSQQLAVARQNSGNTQTLEQLAKNIAADKHAELKKEVASQQCINNLKNLAPTFRETILARYEGTQVGRISIMSSAAFEIDV